MGGAGGELEPDLLPEETRQAFAAILRRAGPIGPAHHGGGDDMGGPGDPGTAFLSRFRLPSPGAGADPALAARWAALGDPPRRRSGRWVPVADTTHDLRAPAGASNAGTALAGSGLWGSSANWSGAVLTARAGERFSAVVGRWRVPGIAPAAPGDPPPAAAPLCAAPSRRCSVWIGLDGHAALAGSLPQVGTTTLELPDGVRCYAWAQWWVRGGRYPEMKLADLEVAPGDWVTARLVLQSPDRVVLRILNERSGDEDGVLLNSGPADDPMAVAAPTLAGAEAPDDVLVLAHPNPAPVRGLAAAWVVERPKMVGAEAFYPLPRIEPVPFEDCMAAVRAPGDPFHVARGLRDLSGRRLLRMVETRGAPWRLHHLATPDRPARPRTRLAVRYAE